MTLLLEYAEWIAKDSPEDALKIFTEDTSEMEQLPRPQILNFFLRNAKNQAIPYLVSSELNFDLGTLFVRSMFLLKNFCFRSTQLKFGMIPIQFCIPH